MRLHVHTKFGHFVASGKKGNYRVAIKDRVYLFWSHTGTLSWSCRREDQSELVTLIQGLSLKDCIEQLIEVYYG